MTVAGVAALNAFLLTNGLDVAGAAAGLHEAARRLLYRSWRAPAPKQALREGLITYLGIQARATRAADEGVPGRETAGSAVAAAWSVCP